ncbi:MAG TPA: hypothetical protein VGH44_00225 [Candidatus Saccharimonadia bacterium]|jgi:hypothetical protein
MTKRMLFVLAAIVLGVLGLYNLSENNKTSHALADEIVQIDSSSSPDVNSVVADLKDFVKTHMGASVTYTLTGSYNRALAASQAAQDPNTKLYADAQQACMGKTDSLTQARCNEAYIQQHMTGVPAFSPVPTPKQSDYQVKLHSPLWTPDLAGALLLGAVVALVTALLLGWRRR